MTKNPKISIHVFEKYREVKVTREDREKAIEFLSKNLGQEEGNDGTQFGRYMMDIATICALLADASRHYPILSHKLANLIDYNLEAALGLCRDEGDLSEGSLRVILAWFVQHMHNLVLTLRHPGAGTDPEVFAAAAYAQYEADETLLRVQRNARA